jgi:hypothetical protein
MFEFLSCHPETVALVVAIPLLAYFLCKAGFEKDTALEDRRRAAGLLASRLTSLGLKRSPKLLTSYSIGDYGSLINDFEQLVSLFLDPDNEDALMKEISGTFESVLTAELATPDGLALVKAKLAALTAPVATAA